MCPKVSKISSKTYQRISYSYSDVWRQPVLRSTVSCLDTDTPSLRTCFWDYRLRRQEVGYRVNDRVNAVSIDRAEGISPYYLLLRQINIDGIMHGISLHLQNGKTHGIPDLGRDGDRLLYGYSIPYYQSVQDPHLLNLRWGIPPTKTREKEIGSGGKDNDEQDAE